MFLVFGLVAIISYVRAEIDSGRERGYSRESLKW